MANELKLLSQTGQTITAQLYSGNAASGSPITMTETGSTGAYFGSVPGATANGDYFVVAISNGVGIASGTFSWLDGKEVTPKMYGETWQIGGLDADEPATNTPTSRTAGDIELDVDGYGTALTTVTRV